MTWAPRALAICVARCPAPPAAPWMYPLAGLRPGRQTPAGRVIAASGIEAASTWLRPAGLGAKTRAGFATTTSLRQHLNTEPGVSPPAYPTAPSEPPQLQSHVGIDRLTASPTARWAFRFAGVVRRAPEPGGPGSSACSGTIRTLAVRERGRAGREWCRAGLPRSAALENMFGTWLSKSMLAGVDIASWRV
jgi:hypothetical protein